MQDYSVIAMRTGANIAVLVSGNLAQTCDSAQIVDKYPGGSIVHIVDPGRAEIYVEYKKGNADCKPAQTPWLSVMEITDQGKYKDVQLFINNESGPVNVIFDSFQPLGSPIKELQNV